ASPVAGATPSAPVVGVDGDVAVGEVAGPHRGAAAADAEIHGDVDLLALHVLRHRRLVAARHHLAVLGHAHAADGDGKAVAVGALAGLAHRHDDAAPVGVLAGNGGLHQRRVGDGKPDAAGGVARGGAAHPDGDELAGALAVAHH